jgi:hypothetical protein
MAAEAHFVRNAALKPYLAALVRTTCATMPQAPASMADAHDVTDQVDALANLLSCARLVSDRIGDKTLTKELTAWSARVEALPGMQSSAEVADDVALRVLTSMTEYWLGKVAVTLPFAVADESGERPVRRVTRSKAPASQAPEAATRVMRARGAAPVCAPSSTSEEDSDEPSDVDDDSDSDDCVAPRGNRKAIGTVAKRGTKGALTERVVNAK